MKKLALLAILAITFTACSSGWNCQKRYVNNKQVIKKHNC